MTWPRIWLQLRSFAWLRCKSPRIYWYVKVCTVIFKEQQECIPVGCVPSTAVAISPAMYTCPPCHARPLSHMPPSAMHVSAMHTSIMHAPLPCTPSSLHVPLPRMPPAMHAPSATHTTLPCMPSHHVWPLPHMPPSAIHTPLPRTSSPVNTITNRCKN